MAGLVEGRVVVVTGGSSGIGRAVALRLAEEGATAVVVADLHEEPREGGEATVALLGRRGTTAMFVPTDVSVPADLAAAVAAAEPFGGVTTMVNNAGVFGGEDFFAITEQAYDRLMAVNVKGTFFGAQAAARSMVGGGRPGTIVNLSSVAGLVGSAAFPTYTASKGAVRLLTYSLAALLGRHGIRVNAVHPGIIETEMTRTDLPIVGSGLTDSVPLRRNGSPEEVADAVVYLAGDLSSYVNGESLVVDGGMTTTE